MQTQARQGRRDVLVGETEGDGVPNRNRGDLVGVQVLGALLQLGKGCQGRTSLFKARMRFGLRLLIRITKHLTLVIGQGPNGVQQERSVGVARSKGCPDGAQPQAAEWWTSLRLPPTDPGHPSVDPLLADGGTHFLPPPLAVLLALAFLAGFAVVAFFFVTAFFVTAFFVAAFFVAAFFVAAFFVAAFFAGAFFKGVLLAGAFSLAFLFEALGPLAVFLAVAFLGALLAGAFFAGALAFLVVPLFPSMPPAARPWARNGPVIEALFFLQLQGRAHGDDLATCTAAFRTQLHQTVSDVEQVRVVLDDLKQRCPFWPSPAGRAPGAPRRYRPNPCWARPESPGRGPSDRHGPALRPA